MAEPTQDGFFREVDEELRREHYAKLWKRYGWYVVAAAVVLVVAVAGYQGWRAYDLKTRTAQGERFAEAMGLTADGQVEAAIGAFSGMAADSGGYAMLAGFQEAALLARNGDTDAAAAAYRRLVGDSGLNSIYRDLALILGAIHEMDGGDPGELSRRLAPLTADDNPWRHSAKELTAVLAVRSGNRDLARELFAWLAADAVTPRGMRSRAGEMLSALSR